MKKILLAAVLALLISGVAVAQDFPRVEVFGGYSLLRIGLSDSDLAQIVPSGATSVNIDTSKFMTKGFNVSAAFNMTPSLGIVADFRYNKKNIVDFTVSEGELSIPAKTELRDISFMAGPRFTLRKNERVTPFAHALVGLDHMRLSDEVEVDGESVDLDLTETSNGLGLALGGGLDVNVNESFAIRLIQADYYLTRHEGSSLNNMNLAFGVVFRFGN